MRTTTYTVIFTSDFRLPGWDESWPAGRYLVTTDEEQLDTSFLAFRRIATRIELQRGPIKSSVLISPQDLDSALKADRALGSIDGS